MNLIYFYTFAQTCALEFPFYALFLRGRSWKSKILAVLALNALTHPVVFFGLMALPLPLLANILVAEVFAFSVKAWACFYFLNMPLRSALLASLSANLFSWQMGPVLTYWLFF